jgi:hypothetical protein
MDENDKTEEEIKKEKEQEAIKKKMASRKKAIRNKGLRKGVKIARPRSHGVLTIKNIVKKTASVEFEERIGEFDPTKMKVATE